MNPHVLHLTGCAPAPLALYLKALGVLRIVAEQADPDARGWWQNEHFCLLTALSADGLEQFLLTRYEPTPFVSPWNRGSGFYSESDPALTALATSTAPRFAAYRTAIVAAQEPLQPMREAAAQVRKLKDRTKVRAGMTAEQRRAALALKSDPDAAAELAAAEREFKALKAGLYAPCRAKWRGPHRRWMDAALVVLDDARIAWPALLGTGGADGRLDFTNNAMLRFGQLFDLDSGVGGPLPGAAGLLRHSLWAEPTPNLTPGAAIGQFLPGSAGGANSTTAPDGASLVDPWDFVLMLEGALMFSGRATRRLDPAVSSRASAPFAVRADGAGHGSRGREKSQRGEQWMPLWSRPATASDLQAMIGEARLQLGRRVASRPIDVATALARLGAARGVQAFTRFGYLERNGQSTLAVPIGRVEVRERPRSHLVDDLGSWVSRLQLKAGGRDVVAGRFGTAEARLSDAVFAALTHDGEPARWQAILCAAADVEAVQAAGTGFEAGPIPPLSPEWLAAADDGTPEWRLACALGSAAARYDRSGRPADPIRHHWLPLDRGARRFLADQHGLTRTTRMVAFGRDAVSDLSAIVTRRLLEAETAGQRQLPIVAAAGCDAAPSDLARLLAGGLDLERLHRLARALMAVRWHAVRRAAVNPPRQGPWPDAPWVAIRLASLPWPLADGLAIPVEQAVVRRLVAGDVAGAVEGACRRLRSSGLRPPLTAATMDATVGPLWAAALAFPVSWRCARAMASSFGLSN